MILGRGMQKNHIKDVFPRSNPRQILDTHSYPDMLKNAKKDKIAQSES